MKGTWDPKKGKYVKSKKEKSERNWIHKNNYIKTKYGIIKGPNTPYVKSKGAEPVEGKD
jgi:hypothetical protein